MSQDWLAQFVLPGLLSLLMLGLGTSLTLDDFRRIRKFPGAFALGVIGQMVLLPLWGWFIVQVFPLDPATHIGILLIALCPGGVGSNLLTYILRADAALSVAMTACTNLMAAWTLPPLFNILLQTKGLDQTIELPVFSSVLQIFFMTVFPVIGGMAIRYVWPAWANARQALISRLSMLFLVILMAAMLIKGWDEIRLGLHKIGLAIFVLNIGATFLGYALGKLGRLRPEQSLTLAIEVGFQNAALYPVSDQFWS